MSVATLSTRAASLGLLAIGGLHVVWATGSSWPLPDRAALADEVVGRPGGGVPPAAACLAVAGLLGTASACVAGQPSRWPRLSRLGAAVTTVTLGTRGALGLAGRTDLLSPGSSSDSFRERDRRIYSPLCMTLSALSLPALSARRR